MTKVKVTRKDVIRAIANNNDILIDIANELNLKGLDEVDALAQTVDKWLVALNKTPKADTKKAAEDVKLINDSIVPFIISSETPVTAKTINDQFIHAQRTNKASAILRKAIEMGLISRDRVRKNANYEYAAPDFDWSSYIEEYDAKVAEKAAARIAKARANRK